MCGNTPLGLQGVGRRHLWGCHSVSHTPTLVAQGSGGLSGRSLDLRAGVLSVLPTVPKEPSDWGLSPPGVWLPCSLRVRRQAFRLGHRSLPPWGGPPPWGWDPPGPVCGPPADGLGSAALLDTAAQERLEGLGPWPRCSLSYHVSTTLAHPPHPHSPPAREGEEGPGEAI